MSDEQAEMFGGKYPVLYWVVLHPDVAGVQQYDSEEDAEAAACGHDGALVLPVVKVPEEFQQAALEALALDEASEREYGSDEIAMMDAYVADGERRRAEGEPR